MKKILFYFTKEAKTERIGISWPKKLIVNSLINFLLLQIEIWSEE